MDNFTYAQPTIIEFGKEVLLKVIDIAKAEDAKHILIVAGKHIRETKSFEDMCSSLEETGKKVKIFSEVEPNPSVGTVDQCGELAKSCDLVIGIGGGSVLDTAKGAALLATNGGSIYEYMLGRGEVIKPISNKLLPTVMIPTTSGSGSEVSACIVVTDNDQIKDLLLNPMMCPTYAVIDTDLMMSMPEYLAAATGLDVLGHAIEGMTSTIATPYSDLQALEAIRLVFKYLVKSAKECDEEARQQMAYASMLAGITQSVGGCTVPHAMSCPLTVHYGIPHGHAVGICQTAAINLTKDIIEGRYKKIVAYVWPESHFDKGAGDILITKINQLLDDLNIQQKYNIDLTDKIMDKLCEDALKDDGVNICAIVPDKEQLKKMFIAVIGGRE